MLISMSKFGWNREKYDFLEISQPIHVKWIRWRDTYIKFPRDEEKCKKVAKVLTVDSARWLQTYTFYWQQFIFASTNVFHSPYYSLFFFPASTFLSFPHSLSVILGNETCRSPKVDCRLHYSISSFEYNNVSFFR